MSLAALSVVEGSPVTAPPRRPATDPLGPGRYWPMGGTPNDRLDSWKEIAEYLRRDITTALRWAKERDLPVHRVPGGKRQAVFAYRREIDLWLENGARGKGLGAGDLVLGARESGLGKRGGRYAVGLLGLCAIVAVTYYLARPAPEPRVLAYRKLTSDGFMKPGGIVTDGARVYFAEARPTGNAIVQVSTSGGEGVPLSTSLKNPLVQDPDRNHSEILVLDSDTPGKPAPLWAVPLSGGLPRRVGNVLAGAAAWSPDGSAIAFSAECDLYLARADGSEALELRRTIPSWFAITSKIPKSTPSTGTCRSTGRRTTPSTDFADSAELGPAVASAKEPLTAALGIA